MNRKLLRCFAVLIVGLGLCGGACANDLITAYLTALQSDPVLKTASYQREQTAEGVPQARAAFLPQITATWDVQRERESFQQLSGPVQPAPGNNVATPLAPAADSDKVTGTARNYELTSTLSIFNLQSYHLLQEAHLHASAGDIRYLNAEQNLVLRVTQAYFGILASTDQLITIQAQRAALGELLRQAQLRSQTGIGADTDVAEAQSFFDATEESQTDAENTLEDAKRALAELVGHYMEVIAPLQEEANLPQPLAGSIDSWAATAREENLDVQAANLDAEAQHKDMLAQRAKYLPNVSLQSSVGGTRQSFALGGNSDLNSIGLTVNWAIYQGGAVQSMVRQARAAYEAAKAQHDLTGRDAERQARLAYRAMSTGIGRIQAARRAMESGRKAVDASQLGLEYGTRTEFDLLNPQNNYYAAVRAYKQSRYDYLTAILQLKFEAGQLRRRDLELIDGLLQTP